MGHEPSPAGHAGGVLDFDFLFRLVLPAESQARQAARRARHGVGEFESLTEAAPIFGGLGSIDTLTAPQFPGRPGFEGFSLRLFEPQTGL